MLNITVTPSCPGRPGLDPWVGQIPWRREWRPTPVFWPTEFHVLYSPWGSQRIRHDLATFTSHLILHLLSFRVQTGNEGERNCIVQWLSQVQLCHPMDCSMPGLPGHHQPPELTQTHVHQVGDAIQPSHPLSLPSPPAFNLSQHQGLFQ